MMPGKKDISKLTKKVITDKSGRQRTVWVLPHQDPHQKVVRQDVLEKFYNAKVKFTAGDKEYEGRVVRIGGNDIKVKLSDGRVTNVDQNKATIIKEKRDKVKTKKDDLPF